MVSICMRDVRERPERVLMGTLDEGCHQRRSEAIRGHQCAHSWASTLPSLSPS